MSMAQIIVFAKAPRPGEVKTRLCPPLLPQDAATLHARMVRRTLATACAAAPGQVELHCSPPIDDPFFASCARDHGVVLCAQADGDIGERMAHAMRDASRTRPLLLIGTDCPARSTDDLRIALHALEAGNDAVLGPVEDGGYSLIGLSRFEPAIFEEIEWSTAQVGAQTRARFTRLGLRWLDLAMSWDVDLPDDLHRLRERHPELLDGIALADEALPR
jgi:rSAM/selenodomain-associated transferase 1